MTKFEELEKRIAVLESLLVLPTEKPAPVPDPYLVPGVPCEVWNDLNYTFAVINYFVGLSENGKPQFSTTNPIIDEGCMVSVKAYFYDHYRVLGTVWDHAPDWAEWVATDESGQTYFYESEPEINGVEWGANARMSHVRNSDPADWQNSLRRRPAWARRKG